MNTLVFQPTQETIIQAAQLLRQGELVAFPTETVYGLGACIFNHAAIKKIYDVKGRPQDNPLIAHISNLNQINSIAKDLPDSFHILAHALFPGPLTLVVPKTERVPDIVSGGTQTVAIRMPNHEVALALITATGEPLVAPSANLSGKPSPTTATDVLEDMNGKIAALIDGGTSTIGIESTVLDLTSEVPTILRPGAVTKPQIEALLSRTINESSVSVTEEAKAPGMKYRHYAPLAHIQLIESWEDMLPIPDSTDEGQFLLLSNIPRPSQVNIKEQLPLSMASIYQAFRYADRQGIRSIIIFLDQDTKNNAGLMNRIEKAALK